MPLAPGYSYETAKLFAELVARRAADELGELVTLQRTIAKRPQSAVYLDYVQVGRGKTIVAPYSVRARDGAPVSTPLDWSRGRGLRAQAAADAAGRRVREVYDPHDALSASTRDGDLWGAKPGRSSGSKRRSRRRSDCGRDGSH